MERAAPVSFCDNALLNIAALSSVTAAATMSHLNSGAQQQRAAPGSALGWTPQQSREYNDLIRQQLGNGGGNDSASVGSLGNLNYQGGGYVEDRFERPTSAPPPPGFVGPDFDDRNRRAEEAIFGGAVPHHRHLHPDDDAFSGITGDSDSAERGFSLTNLVDVLGTGFADSAEDSSGGGAMGGYNQHADALLRQRLADNPNLHRQTRHTASRLIGAPGAPAPAVSAFAGPEAFRDHSRLFAAPEPTPHHHQDRGFPSSLSSPLRSPEMAQGGDMRRSTTPAQMHAGARPYPLSKDIGMNVDEPNDGDSQFSGKNIPDAVVSKRMDEYPAQGGPYRGRGGEYYGGYVGDTGPSTLNSHSKEFRPASQTYHDTGSNDGASTASEPGTDVSPHQCEAELDPFIWEVGGRSQSSRTIAILHATWLKPPEVRSECEQFGALEAFRSEFAPKGIYFASYYDIRSAEIAASELEARLQRIGLLHGGSDDILVRFCLPLNSSSQFDESQIVINGLGDQFDEAALTSMLRSYGAVRSCVYKGPGSYSVEFQNLQDAKQAMLELESTLPWGPDVNVEVSPRNPSDRRKGRELLSTISLWRKGMSRQGGSTNGMSRQGGSEGHRFGGGGGGGAYQQSDFRGGRDPSGRPMGQHDGFPYGGGYGGVGGRETMTQLIMGPDGRYTPVVLQNAMGLQSHGQFSMDPRGGQQQIIHGPNGQIFISSLPQHGGYSPAIVTGSSYGEPNRRGGGATPYYSHSVASDNISVHSGRSHGTHGTHLSHQSVHDDKDNRHLMLDLDAVEAGRDTRTSLMVRNIPNKYTQQMLLNEFTENGHGPGIIDFFYLPIDFKNRCNRGYAFINFVNFQDILAFHRRYYGKQWRTFNSDKICDITYARIQGKAAMLKRFENSALMDKDDEYKPLVFASDGPDKGMRLPFADPSIKPV